MVVVDASTVVALLVESSPAPIRQRLEAQPLSAPHVVDLEVLSALRRGIHQGVLSRQDAELRVVALQALPIDRHAHSALMPRIWALRENVTAYDAAYVALAEFLGVPLLTMDGRLARAPGIACEVELLSA